MKKVIVAYDSRYGNTEKIAKALAKGIKRQEIAVDSININQIKMDKIADYDFLMIGGPTHMLGISKPMKIFLERLNTVSVSGKGGFAFDTRNPSRFNRFDLNSAAKKIEKKMKKMKIKIMKRHESALVEGREGPLKQGTQEIFQRLGVEIGNLIQ